MRENSAKDFTRHTYLTHEIVFCSAGFLIVLITNSQQHIRGVYRSVSHPILNPT
jgi:hypothetical protein